MANNYSRWYRPGTAAVTNGSKAVTGKDTYWASAGILPGDIFSTDGDHIYEIDSITDNTHLTLKTAYAQRTDASASYMILRNFTATMPAQVAAQTCDLLHDFRRYLDADMQTLKGKSAYEIACEKGYDGTETEWLESLIGAGQWNSLDARTEILAYTPAHNLHRTLYRGKNLGTEITETQYEAIRSGKFTDLWLGDVWTLNIEGFDRAVRATIADFNYFNDNWQVYNAETRDAGGYAWDGLGRNHLVLYLTGTDGYYAYGLTSPDFSITAENGTCFTNMNDTSSTEGGFAGSKMSTEILPMVNERLASYFGDHLRAHVTTYSNAVTDGKATGYVHDYKAYAMLLNLNLRWGVIDNKRDKWMDNDELPFAMFRFPQGNTIKYGFTWLRDVRSATQYYHTFPSCPYFGMGAAGGSNHAYGQLCPYIIIA